MSHLVLVGDSLTVFNDAILRLGFTAGIPVIDLRLICSEDADYANAIEPSSHGGAENRSSNRGGSHKTQFREREVMRV